jgi:hypothetical protein
LSFWRPASPSSCNFFKLVKTVVISWRMIEAVM